MHTIVLGITALLARSAVSLELHRRRLAPTENIIAHIDSQLANGIEHPHFTLTAKVQDENLFAPAEPLSIDVALTKPSVGDDATFSVNGGASFPVNNKAQFLVSAEENSNGDGKLPAFAILSIDRDTNTVSGLVEKDGKLIKLEQREGGETIASEVHFEAPKDWHCDVDHLHSEEHEILDLDARRLKHDHGHDHTHEHGHVILDMSYQGISNLNLLDPKSIKYHRKAYATDTFPNKWTYQVDLFIDVDDEFVNNHGSLEKAITYVNGMITAVSKIYEREIDTHLNVLHVQQTSMYNEYNKTLDVLLHMQGFYGAADWHYTDGNGNEPDIHHAILGRLSGGIAYGGTVCNSYGGFGVSAGVDGSLDDLDGSMYWDIKVIAHEIGHNFNAGHTHDVDDFSPIVDGCGLDTSICTSLVDGALITNGAASIMSYCHAYCGGVARIGTTFGGYWNEGLRSDINSWTNMGTFGVEPRRVPKVMYDFVSSLGSCVDPYLAIETQTCNVDSNSDCNDGNACTVDTCSAGQCVNTMQDFCCGNFICETGESSCSDCGPFSLSTTRCGPCFSPAGMMFNIEATSSDITVTGFKFYALNGITDISVYTVAGDYANHKFDELAWTNIFSSSFAIDDTWLDLEAVFSGIKIAAGASQAFYIYSSGELLAGYPFQGTVLAEDGSIKVSNPSRATGDLFGGDYGTGLSWSGSVIYSIDPPSPKPSVKPTQRPTRRPKIVKSRKPRTRMPTPPPTVVRRKV